MSRLDLSKLSVPDAQLIQRGLAATGHYTGTFFGIPGPKTQAAYDAYRAGLTPGSLPWMTEANRWLGLREIAGPQHEPQILSWWEAIKSHFRDDETPWCAAFVGGVLEEVGIRSTRSEAARSYEKWGDHVSQSIFGSVAVFWRGSPTGWQGHVAFLVGVSETGDLFCLGGNQGDAVTVARFPRSRLLGFRFPPGNYERRPAPVMAGPKGYSTGEA